jgi:hypothetical protein
VGNSVITNNGNYILKKFVLFERTFKMLYKLSLQLFRMLLGFRNKSTYFDQKQRAFRHLGYAFDMHTSQVG